MINQDGKTLIEGRIYKGIGGFYYVDTPEGEYTCRARGKLRTGALLPCVGDRVTVLAENENERLGTVQEILPRTSCLIRPLVANVDCAVLVLTPQKPAPNLPLADKILAALEQQGIAPVICINKQDLPGAEALEEIYRPCGYPMMRTCAESGDGIARLVEEIQGRTTVFAGSSGVGKSSLINAINRDFSRETGSISEKIQRGRHTTRHVELFQLRGGGYVADTPGFSRLELPADLEPEELPELFREFSPYLGGCRFQDCTHTAEPGCAVLDALQKGEIHAKRHSSYVVLYEELQQRRRDRWK